MVQTAALWRPNPLLPLEQKPPYCQLNEIDLKKNVQITAKSYNQVQLRVRTESDY